MLVMFSDNGVLLLGLTAKDVDTLADGKTLEYINPPHGPQLIRDIVVMAGADKADIVRQIQAGGVQITEASLAELQRWERDGIERTDRPPKAN